MDVWITQARQDRVKTVLESHPFEILEYGAASFFPCSRSITGLMSLVSARELRLALVLHSMNIILHSLGSGPCLERLLHILLCTYLTRGTKAPLQKDEVLPLGQQTFRL